MCRYIHSHKTSLHFLSPLQTHTQTPTVSKSRLKSATRSFSCFPSHIGHLTRTAGNVKATLAGERHLPCTTQYENPTRTLGGSLDVGPDSAPILPGDTYKSLQNYPSFNNFTLFFLQQSTYCPFEFTLGALFYLIQIFSNGPSNH